MRSSLSAWVAVAAILALSGSSAFGQGRGNCGGGTRLQVSGAPASNGNYVQQLQAYQRQMSLQAQQYQLQQLQAQQMQAQSDAQQLNAQWQAQVQQAQLLQARRAKQLRGGN